MYTVKQTKFSPVLIAFLSLGKYTTTKATYKRKRLVGGLFSFRGKSMTIMVRSMAAGMVLEQGLSTHT